MCTWFSVSWWCFQFDRKCLFLCIYNPQITISPTSLFSANFNKNRVKNHPQPWTCPNDVDFIFCSPPNTNLPHTHTHILNLSKKQGSYILCVQSLFKDSSSQLWLQFADNGVEFVGRKEQQGAGGIHSIFIPSTFYNAITLVGHWPCHLYVAHLKQENFVHFFLRTTPVMVTETCA